MALVADLVKTTKDRTKIHEPVSRCEYFTFVKDGETYVQLDTYGKPGREQPNTPSQMLQFDGYSWRILKKILQEIYPN
jgi:hypothetical protein